MRRSYFLLVLEAHRAGVVRCRGISGDGQAADALTKPLPRKRFVELRDFFMNTVNRVRLHDVDKGDNDQCVTGKSKSGRQNSTSTLAMLKS